MKREREELMQELRHDQGQKFFLGRPSEIGTTAEEKGIGAVGGSLLSSFCKSIALVT